MSDERHDEIAARLRAEAGARAPDRLRADVMLQVRAEPRPRRIRPRHRRTWRPLGAVAAVACVLAALVVGLSHGSGSSPEAALTGAGATAGGGKMALGPHSSGNAVGTAPSERAVKPGHRTASPSRLAASSGRQALHYQAANLPPGLRRALESLLLDRGRGSH